MGNNLEKWAKEIADKNEFKINKEIYRGFYYTLGNLRNVIYDGIYKGKEAVLKVYDDPRISDEPSALGAFNKLNNSKILIAPKLYKLKLTTAKKGWFIMEKLSKGRFLNSPLQEGERGKFIELYLEYRKNFSKEPTRKLFLVENLPAHAYHCFRISRWLQLANDKEAGTAMNGEETLLEPKKFVPIYEKSIALIQKEFLKRNMIWCHGHFKPHEIFAALGGKYYLTDFAHVEMYPEGYELAFIIWADWMMSADWKMSYKEWRKGIFEWLRKMEKINKVLKFINFKSLMRASLVERIIGAILADVCASDRPREEKEKRVGLLYNLLGELL